MKKFAVLVAVVLSIALVASCGGGAKYSDLRGSFDKMFQATEKFSKDMEGANDANSVAVAMKPYVDAMLKFSEESKDFDTKYPEFASGAMPAELKDLEEKSKKMEESLTNAMGKLMQYMQDPAVLAEMSRMTTIGQ